MKTKVTKKSIQSQYRTILKVSYCALQYLLSFQNEFAYSTRAEGWACDYYDIDGICISTGYAPIGESVGYDICKEYDDKALVIKCDNSMSYEQQKELIDSLLNEFIEKVKEV